MLLVEYLILWSLSSLDHDTVTKPRFVLGKKRTAEEDVPNFDRKLLLLTSIVPYSYMDEEFVV